MDTLLRLDSELSLPFRIHSGETIQIFRARTPEDLQDIGRFRFKEHVVTLNKRAQHADHDAETLIEPLDYVSIVLLARTTTGTLVGTVRVTLRPNYERDLPWFVQAISGSDMPNSAYVSRLVVSSEHRGTCIAKRLFVDAYRIGVRSLIQRCFIYCAPALQRFYERWGFVRLPGVVYHPDDGAQLALELSVFDLTHLERTRSPFMACLSSLLSGSSVTAAALESA